MAEVHIVDIDGEQWDIKDLPLTQRFNNIISNYNNVVITKPFNTSQNVVMGSTAAFRRKVVTSLTFPKGLWYINVGLPVGGTDAEELSTFTLGFEMVKNDQHLQTNRMQPVEWRDTVYNLSGLIYCSEETSIDLSVLTHAKSFTISWGDVSSVIARKILD